MNILFVCTGNTCRSPMAKVIAKKILPGHNITSAGVAAWSQSPASNHAVEAVKEMGLDLSGHLSNQLQSENLDEYDIILTMTKAHRQIICDMNIKAADKVFTLYEYVNEEGDIEDPFGKDLEVYKKCAAQLEDLIKRLFPPG